MDILHSGPEVALIIASWASEFFLAALFLRVVILPSITQTNARFWRIVSSRTSEGTSLIFEDVYDRAIDSWIVEPIRGWAQQLWALRYRVSAGRQYMLLQAPRAYRMIPRHLRELELPRGLIRSFIEGSRVIAETLIHGWKVAFRATMNVAEIVVTSSIRGLTAIRYLRDNQTPEDVRQNIPDDIESRSSASSRSNLSSSSSSTATSTWKLLATGPRSAMFPTPRYDLRRADPGFRSSLKMPSAKTVKKRHTLFVATGWRPKDLEPEYWRWSPLRQGIGFVKRKAGMHSPRFHRAVHLNRLRPPIISRALSEMRRNLVPNEPETPIRPRHKFKVTFALPPQSPTDTPEQSTTDSVGQDQWVPDTHVDLSTPVPSIRNLQHRDPQRILSALHLYQLQKMLIWIHCDFIKLSSDSGTLSSSVPETFGLNEALAVKTALQAAADQVSMFGSAEDLRGFGASFFGSLLGLLDTLISQLHSALLLFEYNPACKGICERAIIAAQSISAELTAARAVAITQKRQAGVAHQVIDGEFITVGEI